MKIWLIIATVLIILGVLLFVIVMTINHWDFTKLSTVKSVTNEHSVTDTFHNIKIKTKVSDVEFALSEDSTCKIVCYEQENVTHSVCVNDGNLLIEVNDERKWFEHIGVNFGLSKITVFLPATLYGSLSIEGSTGYVKIPQEFSFADICVDLSTGGIVCNASVEGQLKVNVTTGTVELSHSSLGALSLSASTAKINMQAIACLGDIQILRTTGKAVLTDVTAKNMTISATTGDTKFSGVVLSEKLSVSVGTGDVTFDGCDATEMAITTTTGDVKGSFLSGKNFIVNTTTGHRNVPNGVTGGHCEINTTTGNVEIEIEE